jgi:crotonobetainyl-CoA:carnitine CoA-transferase CaiB-like acyl-CoA transferase
LLRTRSTAEWLGLFDKADIPAMALGSIDELLKDPHLHESGFFSSEQHPSEGRLRAMAYPSTWSVSQPGATRHAPSLGEHTREVLAELGYDAARIDALTA